MPHNSHHRAFACTIKEVSTEQRGEYKPWFTNLSSMPSFTFAMYVTPKKLEGLIGREGRQKGKVQV